MVAKNYSATFDLRELVERAESATPDCAKLNPDPELYLHSLNYYLQYQTGKRFDLTRAGLLNLHRDALGQHLQSVITAYGEVHNWLVDQSFKVNKGRPLVPNMMLSSIAAAEMCHPGALRTPELRSVLTAWALATLWNDSTYNKVRALPELPRLMELFSAKSPTFGLLSATAQATPITVQDLIEMGPSSKKYQIAHAIMKMKQRTDLLGEVIQSAEELEDHHILPKSICLKRGISLELVNCIGNRVLVSSNTNKKVASDYMPNDYYDFAKQFVPEYTLRQGFEAAFIDRTMRETAYNVNSDALFTEWMTPRLEKIAGALNEYFGLFYTTTA